MTANPETGSLSNVALNGIRFNDIFDLNDTQKLQDLFSDATGVASIITYPDGKPITRPSNFCRLCNDIIRKTEKGLANCLNSDAKIGSQTVSGPVIQPCLSGGLWDAGASITVGGKHIANWLIGQVRDVNPDEQKMKHYAAEIGVNHEEFIKAFLEVPVMSAEQFEKVAKMLYAFATELSGKAYSNLLLKKHISVQEEAQSMLQKSEENLALLLRSIGDGVISTDINGLIVSMNPKAETLCGWSATEAIGTPVESVFNITNPETGKTVTDILKKVIESGQIQHLAENTLLLSRNGEKHFVSDSGAPLKNNEGVITGMVLVFSDGTTKYETEKALHESERSKSVLLSNMPGIAYRCRFDREWTMEFISDGCLRLTGYESEAITNNRDISFNDLILPEYREHLWKAWENAVRNHEPMFEEYRILTADKIEKWVWEQGIPIYNAAGDVEALEGLIIDITERKNAENALQKSEERYRTLIDHMGEGVGFLNNDNMFIFTNPSAEKIFGVGKDELSGVNLNDFLSNEDIELIRIESLNRSLGKSSVYEHEIILKDGTRKDILITATPSFEGNTFIGTFAIFRDITDRKTADRLLKESEEKYRILIENANEAIYVVQNKVIVYANALCSRITGIPDNELLGKSIMAFSEKENRKNLVRHHKDLVTGELKSPVSLFSIKNSNGEKRWLSVNSVLIHWNGKEATLNFATDITERKQADEALNNERLLLRTLIDNIPDSIYSKDLAGRKTLANKAEVSILGANSESDVLGKTDFEFYPAELAGKFTADDQLVLQTGIPAINIEECLFDQDGKQRWLLSSKLPLRDKSNQIIGLVGIGRDITERKKSDMALQESEELYRNLVEKLPDGVYKSTDEGRFVDVNPAMVKMLGYSNKEELLSIDIKTQLYFKASDRENVELQEKLEKIGVYRMKKKDGSEIWVEDHGWLNFDEKSGILFHEGIMRDVTERKRAELALQESEALYRNLVEKLPDGVYKSTHDGKFVDVNPAMVNILGYASKEELMKIDIKTQLYFEPEDRESIVLMEKLEEMGVYRMKKKDGSEIWVEDHGWYNLDENGNINFHEGILRDITERKIAEEEIKSKNEELTKIVAEKDKFFSILAHDLRSPFNSFLGLTHIMAEELPRLTMDEIQKIAVSMKNSATNLFRLLENLLQWSQMQQGLIPYDPKEAPLGPIVDESITMMREPANNKEIEIICNIPATLHVYADSNILQTVIRNLVSNAVKFTQKGGKIQISAKSDVNNTIKIAVQDSGIGISQTMLGNLFKVDIQTNRKGTEGEPSTGLGLLLCKEFIEKHGGRIWAESEEGKGSVFHFTVPETSSSNEKSDQSKDAVDESDKITRLKVLVAEDDNTSGMLISKALKPYSKEILIAKNGLDAIDICHKNPDLDLIMMDIKMPGIDGYETTREIRKFNKDVIIIAQTAFSQINDIEKAKAAGCNDYLIKPLEIPMLVALIQRHFTSKMKKINVVKSQDN